MARLQQQYVSLVRQYGLRTLDVTGLSTDDVVEKILA